MINRTWLKMLKPYGYHDMREVDDVFHVDVKKDVDFFVNNGIAEIVETEMLHFKTESDGIDELPES